MKKYIILFSILSWNMIYAQSYCKQDSTIYSTVYSYIINDSINNGKSIDIYDFPVKLNIAVFWRELKETNESETSLFTRLYNIHQKTDYMLNFTSLSKDKKNAKSIVFFSPIFNDSILCAELFDDKKYHKKSTYDRIAFQNQSHFYLFILNATGTIKTVFRKEMIYN
ncbi:hypothetical protein [Bacteroides sp.]